MIIDIKKYDTSDKILDLLNTYEYGLSTQEAYKRLSLYGENLIKTSKINPIYIFFKQFKSSLVLLLLLAIILSFVFSSISDGITISFILIINTILGFSQEYKSEKTAEKLQKLISNSVEVLRDNKEVLLGQKDITIGDIVILKEGDVIAADARIIKSNDFYVDESALTGESIPINKFPQNINNISELLKSPNFVFTGTIVTHGYALACVYSVGMQTQIGQILKITTQTRKVSSYEININKFSQLLIYITCIALFVLFIFHLIFHNPVNLVEFFLFVIALAISVVPEALPVITTLTMSSGAALLAKKKVIVKRISALEDFGNLQILCTDKTGTLTENNLQLVDVVSNDLEKMYLLSLLSIEIPNDKRKNISHSFDECIYKYLRKLGKIQMQNYTKNNFLPFDPIVKRKNTLIYNDISKETINIGMGAPENLIATSNLSSEQKLALQNEINLIGEKGLRSIAISYKNTEDINDFENTSLLGYFTFEDPIKPSTMKSISTARQLGIEIKILTGDSVEVAKYVGQKIHLINESSIIYSGTQLNAMNTEEFNIAVNNSSIFARIDPQQKYKIIEQLKINNIVGYQGDGINDTPSLKLANVSIAVNTASDVAKETADVILLRNDLDVVIEGIKLGRIVFQNINKYIRHTMISNFGTFFVLCIIDIVSSDFPLLPIQILLFSLLSDIPLLAISTDRVNVHDLKMPEQFESKKLLYLSLGLGVLTSIFILIFIYLVKDKEGYILSTSLFIFLNVTASIIIFSIRNKDAFYKGVAPSRMLIVSVIGVIIFTFYLPFSPFKDIFHLHIIDAGLIGLIILMSIVYFVVLDAVKIKYMKFLDNHIH